MMEIDPLIVFSGEGFFHLVTKAILDYNRRFLVVISTLKNPKIGNYSVLRNVRVEYQGFGRSF